METAPSDVVLALGTADSYWYYRHLLDPKWIGPFLSKKSAIEHSQDLRTRRTMTEDDLDAAWFHHEQLQHEFEELMRREYPQWFIHRRDTVALVKDMIQSKFLRKEDFDEDQVCTIRDCKLEQVGKEDAAEERWVLYFRERDKGMVLNITTIRVLEQAFGGDTDHWVGNKVKVYVDPNVSFGGKIVGGLRLRTSKKQEVKAPPVKDTVADDEFNDSIPF